MPIQQHHGSKKRIFISMFVFLSVFSILWFILRIGVFYTDTPTGSIFGLLMVSPIIALLHGIWMERTLRMHNFSGNIMRAGLLRGGLLSVVAIILFGFIHYGVWYHPVFIIVSAAMLGMMAGYVNIYNLHRHYIRFNPPALSKWQKEDKEKEKLALEEEGFIVLETTQEEPKKNLWQYCKNHIIYALIITLLIYFITMLVLLLEDPSNWIFTLKFGLYQLICVFIILFVFFCLQDLFRYIWGANLEKSQESDFILLEKDESIND